MDPELKTALEGFTKPVFESLQRLDKELKEERRNSEEIERKLNRLGLGGGGSLDASTDGLGHKQADNEALRTFFASRESKAMSVGVEADGGALVMPYFSGAITRILREQNPLRTLARIVPVSGSDRLEEISDTGDLTATWVGETEARPETSTPQIGKIEIPTHELYAAPKVTQKLIDDSAVDIAAWLAEKVGSRFARTELAAFVTGDGVSKPRGFATYPTAATADDTRPWGTIEHVVTGANGAFLSGATQADCLIDLVSKLKVGYRPGATWLMSRSTAALIRKMKEATTNAYIWQPSMTAGQPDQLLGFPVALCEDMPAVGTGSLSVWFGNWRSAYTIVDRVQVRLLQDPYTAKPYVVFYYYRRVGGAVNNFEALKALKFST